MKRILIPVILVVTILVGGVLAYAIWQAVPVSSEDYFNSGKKYYDQADYSKAIIQLLNSIQKEPKNRNARFYLALSYQNSKDLNDAAKQLVALLEYYPDDVEANLRLGNIYLTGGRLNPEYFHKVADIAQKILAKDPKNVAALVLSGNAAAGLQDYRSSVDLFEQAVALDPQNTAAFVSLGSSQALQKNFPEAEQAFLKARQVDPKDKSALISLGNYYRAVRDLPKAESIFKEALSNYPTDRDIYLQLVSFYYQNNRVDDAEKILRDVQAKSPKDPAPSLTLAGLYVERNRMQDARTLLFDLKKSFPDSLDVAGQLAMNLMGDQPDQARVEIDRLLKIDPKNVAGMLLLAQIQFFSGKYDEAESTLTKNSPIVGRMPQSEFILGQIALKRQQLDPALDHFQKSLALNSNYLPARVGLAEVLMDKGRIADSRVEAKKVLDVQPGLVSARILKATLDMTEKKWTDAEPELVSLVKDQPNNALVHRQMALYLDARGRTADAEKSFLRVLELQPDSRPGFQDLLQFYVKNKQTDRAIQKLNSVPDDKKQGYHYEMLASVYLQAGKLQDAEVNYKKAVEKDPSSSTAVASLAGLYIQSNRLDEGLKELDVLTTRNPSNAGAYTVKGMIREKQEKLEDAKQNYNQALKADPNSEAAGNNLAFILADQGQDLNSALGYAQMARKKQPDSAAIADTLGWVYYKLGNHLLARDQLQFATGKEPANPEFQYHLGMIYKGNKQMSEAKIALTKAASSPQPFKEKSMAQAALAEVSAAK